MSPETNQLYAFGDFQLDLGEGVVRCKDAPLNMTPKSFHVLKILVLNHGHIVDKETLMSEIWADSFVEDGNLAVTIAMLRKALGDDAAHPIYIETIARRGYRFVAPVTEISAVTREPSVQTRVRSGSRKVWPIAGLALAVLVISGFGGWYFSLWPFSRASAPILSTPFKSEPLTSTGNAGAAAISPDGKFVAFTEQNNGRWSIWLRQLATSENIQVAPPIDQVYGGLVFSRDSSLLYFVRGEPGKRLDLYRVSAFGGVPVKLVDRTEGWISFAPDGQNISFVRCLYQQDDFCSLFVAEADGRNERRVLTRAQPIRISDNQFSPDGRYIAFASGQSATGSADFSLSKVDLSDGREIEITPKKFFDISGISWVMDGRNLLISARERLSDSNSVWHVSIATGTVVQVTNDGSSYSKISLDDAATKLVATRIENDFKVWIASVDDLSNPRRLADGVFATFLPDGRVAYQSKSSDIWTIGTDGSDKRQLTNDPLSDINPIASADGRLIFFTSNRLGTNQVWRMNIDGTDQLPISGVEGGYPRFATPDGKWVYYQSGLNNLFRKVATDGSEEIAAPEVDGIGHAFSPDGTMVAYFMRDKNGTGDPKIGIRRLSDAATIRTLSYAGDDNASRDLAWLADNRTLFFVTTSDQKYQLWRTSLDLDKPVLVGGLGTENFLRFAVSYDGRSIVTIRGNWRQDTVLITGFR